MAISACRRVSHDLRQISPVLMVFKKVSTAALTSIWRAPLKWCTHRDMIIPFSGGPEGGWKAREKMKQFVGLDVSMKETAVCVVDEAGQRIWEGSVPSTADAIAAIIVQKAPDLVRAGMETGPQAVWLWHALRDQGIPVDCIHARRAAAALKLQANKTDRNDAFGLARLVHGGGMSRSPSSPLTVTACALFSPRVSASFACARR